MIGVLSARVTLSTGLLGNKIQLVLIVIVSASPNSISCTLISTLPFPLSPVDGPCCLPDCVDYTYSHLTLPDLLPNLTLYYFRK